MWPEDSVEGCLHPLGWMRGAAGRMIPEAPAWLRRICQTRPALSSDARYRALRTCGPCVSCGRGLTDGMHTGLGGPLLCDLVMPLKAGNPGLSAIHA